MDAVPLEPGGSFAPGVAAGTPVRLSSRGTRSAIRRGVGVVNEVMPDEAGMVDPAEEVRGGVALILITRRPSRIVGVAAA